MYAARHGQLEVVKYLTEQGADVNAKSIHGFTAMMYAARRGQGADVNAKSKHGFTAMMYAARHGQLEVVRYLAEQGADVNGKDNKIGWTAMMWAARHGQLEVVKYFVEEQGADVDAKDKTGFTVMFQAGEYGHLRVVKYLAEQGADVNTKNKYGKTAMMYAARHGQLEVVKYLAEQGADVNAKSKHGFTAMFWAGKNGHLPVVKYLAEQGADVWAVDPLGVPLWRKIKDKGVVQWWRQQVNTWKLFQRVAGNKKTYMALLGGLAIALVLVLLQRYWDQLPLLPTFSSPDYSQKDSPRDYVKVASTDPAPLREGSRAPYRRGAQLLAAKSLQASRHGRLKAAFFRLATLLFRITEILANVVFVFALGMLVVWWPFWIPLIFICFFVPAFVVWPPPNTQLLHTPALAFATRPGHGPKLLSLLRCLLLLLLVAHVAPKEAVWSLRRVHFDKHWDMWLPDKHWRSDQLGHVLEALVGGAEPKLPFLHTELPVHAAQLGWLPSPLHGLQGPLGSIEDDVQHVNVLHLMWAFFTVALGSPLLYMLLLLLQLLMELVLRFVPRAMDADHGRELGRKTADILEAESDAMPTDVDPVTWSSLLPKVGFFVLDVVFDVNTIFTPLASDNFLFACMLQAIVSRCFIAQFLYNRPTRICEATAASMKRGILRSDLLEMLDEEKGFEGVLNLALTAYSLPFCIMTFNQAFVQLLSIMMSISNVATFVYEQIDLNMVEGLVPLPDEDVELVPVPKEDPVEKLAETSLHCAQLGCLPLRGRDRNRGNTC